MTSDAKVTQAPPITEVEQHSVETIPDEDRSAQVLDLFRVEFGGANTFATAVLGAFPIILGLSFWQGVVAIVSGVTLGGLILAPMALFGPLNGTNNAVSSGAHFGVVGRVCGSFLSLLTAIAFFSISVWSSGDALVGAAHKVAGLPESNAAYALAYAVFALAVLTVCIYGFQFMLFVNKIAVAAATVLFVLGFAAFAGHFHPSAPGAAGPVGSAGFWTAFVGSAMIALSNPISFGAFLGDWTRYIPRSAPRRQLLFAAFAAQVATLLPFLFGLMVAAVTAEHAPQYIKSADFAGGLLAVSPGWYFVPVIVIALIGGMSTGTTSLYGTGLDFSSVFPRLSRVQATLLIGAISIALIFIGRFAFSLAASITTFVTLIIVCTTPWMVVMTIGYVVRRGFYLPDHLQVFNRGMTGGAYWFTNGWNVPAMTAWVLSAVLSVLAVNQPGQFIGPIGRHTGGMDYSLVLALLLPAVLYPALLFISPDPRAVFGPEGPRFVPSSDTPVLPFIADVREAQVTR